MKSWKTERRAYTIPVKICVCVWEKAIHAYSLLLCMFNDDTTGCVLRVYCDKGLEMRRLLQAWEQRIFLTQHCFTFISHTWFLSGVSWKMCKMDVCTFLFMRVKRVIKCVCVCKMEQKRDRYPCMMKEYEAPLLSVSIEALRG